MASDKEYLTFILEQLSDLENITYKPMMGEYILYYRGKIFGGIYDDRLLVKPTKTALAYMPNAVFESPYDGAKEHYILDIENRDLAREVTELLAKITPLPKKRVKK